MLQLCWVSAGLSGSVSAARRAPSSIVTFLGLSWSLPSFCGVHEAAGRVQSRYTPSAALLQAEPGSRLTPLL